MSDKCVWANCVTWLERCGVLSPQQACTIDSIQQLASFVRDGVLLCHLANKLHPEAIDLRNFSQKPKNSQFLCKKNIDAFLHAARKVFGIKEKDLFTQKEILEMTNFGKVLVTLSKLSEIDLAKKQGIRPFSIEIDAVYVIMEEKIEDEIYSNSSPYDTKLNALDESEQIYDSLVYKSNINETTQAATKSEKCIEELLNTEKRYLDILSIIKYKFQEPLKEKIEDRLLYDSIFFKSEEIFALHKCFYADLSSSRTSGINLASCFNDYKMRMTIYGDYCAHLSTAVQDIPIFSKNNPIARDMIEKAGIEAKVKLHDLLIMPFQRFFKYHLLIKEIIKNMAHEGEGIDIIVKWKEALASIEDLALYINELTGGREALLEMETITKSFDGGLRMGANTQLKDYGRRLFDGEFYYKSPKEHSFSIRHIFLFEKLCLLCKPIKKNLLKYTEFIKVSKSTISIENVDREKQLWLTNDELEHKFTALKEDMLYKLEEFFNLALENIDPAGATSNGHNFVLTNFDDPTLCDVCKNLLRGALSQGYKCQRTNKVVHKECILLATNSVSYRKGDILIATCEYNGRPKFGNNEMLIFSKGTIIELVKPSNGLWLQGKLNEKVGYFPFSNIKLLDRPSRIGYENHEIDRSTVCAVMEPPASLELDLNAYPWYMGNMAEVNDNSIFDNCLDGTFLVRQAKDGMMEGSHTIVLKYLKVRKLKIHQKDKSYYLSKPEHLNFLSIVDLIEYYRINSLSDIFSQIESTLKYPYKERDTLLTCVAISDFSATNANQLSFQKGDVIKVTKKSEKVWWQGTLRNETGFIPRSYVH